MIDNAVEIVVYMRELLSQGCTSCFHCANEKYYRYCNNDNSFLYKSEVVSGIMCEFHTKIKEIKNELQEISEPHH